MTFKDIQILCEYSNIEFKNQSFVNCASIQRFLKNADSIRHKFTIEEGKQIFEKILQCNL
jgi:hypothetical protein